MANEIDINIDKMLQDLYSSPREQFGYGYIGYLVLSDANGYRYDSKKGGKIAKLMHEKGLIQWAGYPNNLSKDTMLLQYEGKEIVEAGGWLAHLERHKQIKNNTKELWWKKIEKLSWLSGIIALIITIILLFVK